MAVLSHRVVIRNFKIGFTMVLRSRKSFDERRHPANLVVYHVIKVLLKEKIAISIWCQRKTTATCALVSKSARRFSYVVLIRQCLLQNRDQGMSKDCGLTMFSIRELYVVLFANNGISAKYW